MHLETALTGFISHSCRQPGQTDSASASYSEDHTHLPSSAFAASQVSSQLSDFYFGLFSPQVHSDTISMPQLSGPSNLKPVDVTLRQDFS